MLGANSEPVAELPTFVRGDPARLAQVFAVRRSPNFLIDVSVDLVVVAVVEIDWSGHRMDPEDVRRRATSLVHESIITGDRSGPATRAASPFSRRSSRFTRGSRRAERCAAAVTGAPFPQHGGAHQCEQKPDREGLDESVGDVHQRLLVL